MTSHGIEHREIVLEELLLLWLANVNPAFAPFRELFDDSTLKGDTAYNQVLALLDEFLQRQPPFGPDKQKLIDMLRSPAMALSRLAFRAIALHAGKMGVAAGQISRRVFWPTST